MENSWGRRNSRSRLQIRCSRDVLCRLGQRLGIVRVTYDNDVSDVTSPVELIGQFGPLVEQRTNNIYYEVTMATAALGEQHGSIESIVIRGAGRSSGDYSASGELDVADIDLLSELVKVGDAFGDLDHDGVTDGSDLAFWSMHSINLT